jgi:hypothetical protein
MRIGLIAVALDEDDTVVVSRHPARALSHGAPLPERVSVVLGDVCLSGPPAVMVRLLRESADKAAAALPETRSEEARS